MSIEVVGTTRITEFRGDTFVRNLFFKDENGDAIDITGWLIHFTLKNNIDDTDEDAVIVKDIETHTDPENGETQISMSAGETYNLVGTYQYDIQFVKPDGTVKTIAKDRIKFEKDVTRRTSV